MKKNEIRVKGIYLAKVSGKLVPVRVDEITEREGRTHVPSQSWIPPTRYKASIRYCVTNLVTNRKTVFRAATKFRKELTPAEVQRLMKDGPYGSGLVPGPFVPGGPCTDLDANR